MENRQAGKTLNEIEITPEMVASGRRELLDFDERYEPAEAVPGLLFDIGRESDRPIGRESLVGSI
jgi:hypothetical protein